MPRGQRPFTCVECQADFVGNNRQTRCPECYPKFLKARRNSPEQKTQRAAMVMVGAAVARGDLIRQPCEVCGERNVHGHHQDYSKPLEVNWLCVNHHRQLHSRGYILGTWRDWTAEFAMSPHLPTSAEYWSMEPYECDICGRTIDQTNQGVVCRGPGNCEIADRIEHRKYPDYEFPAPLELEEAQ